MDAGGLLAAPVEIDQGGDAYRQEGDRERHDHRSAHEREGHRDKRQGEGAYDDGSSPG
jgi:hypothetical protein